MIEIVRTTRPVKVDESDLISLKEAAELTGRKMSGIGNMLDRGALPWYELPAPPGLKPTRTQRYTSRAALSKLPAEKTRGLAARKTRKPRATKA